MNGLLRYLQNSAESAKRAAPSRLRLSKSCCFNARIMSRARKPAVGGILQVPLLTFRWRTPDLAVARFQQEPDPAWAEEVAARPGCEGLFSCLQCGTCTGTCPVSAYMDIGPRRVIALVREGFREEALTCQTIWLCASCYSCDVECPSQIRLTDIMGALKREAVRRKIYPRRFPAPMPEQEICQVIRLRGRRSEFRRVIRMALRCNPLQLLTMMRTGWRLIRNGAFLPRMQWFNSGRELQANRLAGNSNAFQAIERTGSVCLTPSNLK